MASVASVASETSETSETSHTLRFTLDPNAAWLRSHAVEGVPLLPAVVGLEWMARAAAALAPDARVSGVEDAWFERPLKVQPGRHIEAVVEAHADPRRPGRIRCRLRSERINRRGTRVHQEHFRAVVRTAPAPAPQRAGRPALHLGRLDHTGPEHAEIYEHLFHTGVFRVLHRVRLVGPTGVVASGRPASLGLDNPADTGLAPLAVEAALQAAGLGSLLTERAQVLPHGVGSLKLHTTANRLHAADEWVLRARALGHHQPPGQPKVVRWDVDVLDGAGELLLTLRDLQLIERAAVAAEGLPATAASVELVEIDVEQLGRPDALVVELDAELGPAEQRRAREISHPGRRLEWVAGRLAAKELVRRHLRDRYGIAQRREGIEIATEPGGAPVAMLPSRPALAPLLPALSITHACGRAVALGQPATEAGVRVGVDLTAVERRPASFAKQWLTEGEQALLAAAAEAGARDQRLAAIWSLKESVSKALGLGLQLASTELEVTALHPDGGAEIRLHGQAAQRYQDLGGRRLEAGTSRWAPGVLGWARLALGEEPGDATPLTPSSGPRPLQGLREARLHHSRA